MQRRFPSRQQLAEPLPRPVDGRRILAAHLAKLRRRRGLSQDALAELTGLNRSYLSLVENARRNVSLDNICKIAAALGVPPHELLRSEL